jgi:hypothetical protein
MKGLQLKLRSPLNLLKGNIPLENIARTTGLTIKQIQALQAQTA